MFLTSSTALLMTMVGANPPHMGIAQTIVPVSVAAAPTAVHGRPLDALGWLVFAGPGPTCSVIDGKFKHVWGGLIQNGFTYRNPNLSHVAYTVEDGGRVRRTLNGGSNWDFLTTPACVQRTLRGVHFLDDGGNVRIGWVVGDNGTVVRAMNAGDAWEIKPQVLDVTNDPAELWDTYFIDEMTGWLAGVEVMKKSTDGGNIWTSVGILRPGQHYQPVGKEYYSTDFLINGSEYIGIAVGEPGLILRTDDTLQSDPNFQWHVVYDYCRSTGLCAPCAPLPNLGDCDNPTSEAFEIWDVEWVQGTDLENAHCIAVGGFGVGCGVILVSADGGFTWNQEFFINDPCNTSANCPGNGNASTIPTLYAVTTFSDGTAICVGYGGSIYVRDVTCSPPVWRKKSIPGFTQPFFGVDGNEVGGGAGVAWITAMFNAIHKTTDGGNSWTTQTDGNDLYRLRDVHFISDNEGWTVGQFYRIAKTSDGGVNWVDQYVTSIGLSLNDIEIASDDMTGVAVGTSNVVGSSAKIVYTTDGSTWNDAASVTPPGATVNQSLFATTTIGTNHFWAVGSNGLVLHSSDGGANWISKPVDLGSGPITNVTLNDVAFSDINTGVVVGTQGAVGKIYLVVNATAATPLWIESPPVSSDTVIDLRSAAVSGGIAYVVGKKLAAGVEQGIVLKWDGAQFTEQTGIPSLIPCHDDPTGGILNEVEIAPASNQVFVGGSCGVMVWFDGSAWHELKSNLSLNISGMSFFAIDGGFVCAGGTGHTAIVKYDP